MITPEFSHNLHAAAGVDAYLAPPELRRQLLQLTRDAVTETFAELDRTGRIVVPADLIADAAHALDDVDALDEYGCSLLADALRRYLPDDKEQR